VANSTGSITVTGTAAHNNATVAGNVIDKALVVGVNTITITVTAEDGTTTQTYTVIVVRAAPDLSSDATLSSLTVSEGALSPGFDANTLNYTVDVVGDVTSINVIGTANHAAATLTGNVTDMELATGDNTVTITVTAEDGATSKTYTVTIVREIAIELTINDNTVVLDSSVVIYTADCDETAVVLDVELSPGAAYTVNGDAYDGNPITLSRNNDETVITIRVTETNGSAQQVYTVKIAPSFDESKLYFQRWNDVIAINHNPATNGGYNIEAVRWYGTDNSIISEKSYIQVPASANVNDYKAEIQTMKAGGWHRVCADIETKSIEQIIVYPNPVPVGKSLTVQLPESFVGGTAKIYDIKGILVKSNLSLPAISNSLNVSDLNSGIYLLHVTGINGNTEAVKIIVE
jgi:hypothetical protein